MIQNDPEAIPLSDLEGATIVIGASSDDPTEFTLTNKG